MEWADSLGEVDRAGVEGTGTYGAGLARYLSDRDIEVIEVNRPNWMHRHRRGKSDPTDAENAARAVLYRGSARRHRKPTLSGRVLLKPCAP